MLQGFCSRATKRSRIGAVASRIFHRFSPVISSPHPAFGTPLPHERERGREGCLNPRLRRCEKIAAPPPAVRKGLALPDLRFKIKLFGLSRLPESRRLSAQQAAEPQDPASSDFSHLLRPQAFRTAGGKAALPEPTSSHRLFQTPVSSAPATGVNNFKSSIVSVDRGRGRLGETERWAKGSTPSQQPNSCW